MPKGYPRELEKYELDELLTVKQLANEIFHVHTNTVYRWVQQHNIPHLRIGNRIFFRKEALREWMEANERGRLGSLGPTSGDEGNGEAVEGN